MEIEKDFHIRVDRVTEGPSGASVSRPQNLSKVIVLKSNLSNYLLTLSVSCSTITSAPSSWGTFRSVSLSLLLFNADVYVLHQR